MSEIEEICAKTDVETLELYLVWSNQHRAWWRPDGCGYTDDVSQAGLYSKEGATSISFQGRDGWLSPKIVPDEIAVPISSVPENMRPTL